MVPSGLIKKMYGPSLFTDEVLKSVDRELIGYLETDKLDIFAQPLPLESDFTQLDVNKPADYTFNFEIGMKPEFQLSDLATAKITKYVVPVTDEMVNNEIDRLQNRHGNMKDEETVTSEENVLNVNFVEADADGNAVEGGITKDNSILVKYFSKASRKKWMGKKVEDAETVQLKKAFDAKELEWILSDLGLKDVTGGDERFFNIVITKVGMMEKRELNEEFFNLLYPNQDVKTEDDLRNKLKEEIERHWNAQANNQIHDQIFHQLVDNTEIKFPEGFLKKWIKTQGTQAEGQAPKTDEEVEQEFPGFLNQLKWTLISDEGQKICGRCLYSYSIHKNI